MKLISYILLVALVAIASPRMQAAPPASTLAKTAAIDFTNDIIPIFTKAGCNTGACHGAAIGRGGLKLSLLGNDSTVDYASIVYDLEGRRVNYAIPEESLLLLKPSEQANHKGGFKLDPDAYEGLAVLNWIRQGTSNTSPRKLTRVDVSPTHTVLNKIGESVRISVTAHYDDGSSRDVTSQTVLAPNDDQAIALDKNANASVHRAGAHIIIARYLNQVIPVQILLPLREEPVELDAAPRHNFIDEQINQTLATLRIPPSGQANDSQFIRRLYLDLTGTLPTANQLNTFISDTNANKRANLIDQLLATESFVDYWAFNWANLFEIDAKRLGPQGAAAYHAYLRKQIAANAPIDRIAIDLLTSSGDSFKNGQANFYRVASNPRTQAEYTSRVLMGVRLGCANCHNHPLDKWTQDDYHGLAAIFSSIKKGRIVTKVDDGETIHPRTGEPATPKLPGDRFLEPSEDGREALAQWLLNSEQSTFAPAVVNRVWSYLMGRGLVEPIDDLRKTNPATHPALLEQLAADFAANDYDLKSVIRAITNSAAYQRDDQKLPDNQADMLYYSHALNRALPAEVIADNMATVTGIADTYGSLPANTRALTLTNNLIEAPLLDILGRCDRTQPCSAPASLGSQLAQTLHLINGEFINKKITDPKGYLHQLLNQNLQDDQTISTLYARTLSREPKDNEMEFWLRHAFPIQNTNEQREFFEDLTWSLLSSNEFLTNH